MTVPSPSFKTYTHWGMDSSTNATEPNNLSGKEACGVANVTQEYEGAWGWSDTNCNNAFVHICRIMRGWRPLLPGH